MRRVVLVTDELEQLYGPFHDHVFTDAEWDEEYDPVVATLVADYDRGHRDEWEGE